MQNTCSECEKIQKKTIIKKKILPLKITLLNEEIIKDISLDDYKDYVCWYQDI